MRSGGAQRTAFQASVLAPERWDIARLLLESGADPMTTGESVVQYRPSPEIKK
jgi:hypothetical protein